VGFIQDVLEAVHWAINTLKERIPIWKKEHYLDGSQWKANKEFKPKALIEKPSL
jgi:molybdopterin synthase catalytic subunit